MAIDDLAFAPDYLLIDAMQLDVPQPQESLIKGDARSISIAAASIIAKVTRDRLMEEYDELYPGYGFKNNAGYGTKEHLRVRKIRNTHSSTYVCANKRYDLKIKIRILILRRCVFVEILQRQLLFKLAVCQGIGNLGILKVLQEAIAKSVLIFPVQKLLELLKSRNIVNYLNNLGYTIRFIEALYIRQCQHQFMTILDAVYPKLLREIYNPPAIFIEKFTIVK